MREEREEEEHNEGSVAYLNELCLVISSEGSMCCVIAEFPRQVLLDR